MRGRFLCFSLILGIGVESCLERSITIEKQTGHKDFLKNIWGKSLFYWGMFSCFVAWAAGTFFGSYLMVFSNIPDINLADVISLFYQSAEFYYSFRCCNLPVLVLAVGSWLGYYRRAMLQNSRDIVVLGIILL